MRPDTGSKSKQSAPHLAVQPSPINFRISASFLLTIFFMTFTLLPVENGHCSDWYWGVKAGFGGTGLSKSVTIEEESITANRSEGPGVFGVSLETMLGDKLSIAIEHRRGFRLGPFSSGVGFTDFTWRWYLLGSGFALVPPPAKEYIFTPKWSYFAGVSVGLAFGKVTREEDLVQEVETSGATVGTKVGADYHYRKNILFRPEVIYSTTFINTSQVQSSMSEFGLMFGTVFKY